MRFYLALPLCFSAVTLLGLTGCSSNSAAAAGAATAAPVASISLPSGTLKAGQMLSFTDASTGSPTAWSWSFGDGGTSTVQHPTHTYSAAGAFTVALTATNAGGSSSASQSITISPAATAAAYPLVDTGQVRYYDTSAEITAPAAEAAFYGQDAQYSGSQPSYTLSSDGKTVWDNTTGLMWQKSPSASHFTWQEAVDYCNALELGGYSDWRMPSIKELFSISDFSAGWPYLNSAYFDLAATPVSKDERSWSSNCYVGTTVEGGADAAFGVNHGTGHIKAYPAKVGGPMGKRVRAVRGRSYGLNAFKDNGDGTISDQATGLMWSRADSGSGMDWVHALAHAQTMNVTNHLGHSDWRLPNVKELQSLVDYTRSPTARDTSNRGPSIDPLFSCTAITNEAGEADYPYYWTSTSARFEAGGPFYYGWYVAFGRAVNPSGLDIHGAGAVRFDTKVKGGPAGEGGERYDNFVRLVRDGN